MFQNVHSVTVLLCYFGNRVDTKVTEQGIKVTEWTFLVDYLQGILSLQVK